jgi:thiol:disulfide interchange protein DsbD
MKKTFNTISFLLLISTCFLKAQVVHTQWQFSTKKITDCEYDLLFTVKIDKGWHITSAYKPKGLEDEFYPTQINFSTSKDYVLIGAIIESKPKMEYDKTLNQQVPLHYTSATFTQRIKLTTSKKVKIKGKYKYQICDNANCAFPPENDFNFDMQSQVNCENKK